MVARSQADLKSRSIELAGWLMGFAWLTIIIPAVMIALLPADDRVAAAATLATTPFLEYLAVSIGIGSGLNPVFSFLITVLPCTGLAMLVVGLLGFLGESSARAKRFLEKVPARIEKYPKLKKYGVASNFFFIMFLGVYIAPGVSLILGWPRVKSVLFMAAGICAITFAIGLATVGILELFFV